MKFEVRRDVDSNQRVLATTGNEGLFRSSKTRPDDETGTFMTFVLREQLDITMYVPQMDFLVQEVNQHVSVVS